MAGAEGVSPGQDLLGPARIGHRRSAPRTEVGRLGLALKVAALDVALAAYPDLRTVDTSNAEANEHMNRINQQLGYRPIETLLELQKRL